MIIWAHRGASMDATENTARAFELAGALGADGVELDVRMTADAQPVVFHDKDMRHAFGRAEAIEDITLEEVRTLRHADGQGVLTLPEALECIASHLRVNVEIKAPRLGAVVQCTEAVIEVLKPLDPERFLMSSFDPRVHWAFRKLSTPIRQALLFEELTPMKAAVVPFARALGAVALHPEAALVSRLLLDHWLADGFEVNLWTINSEIALRHWANEGASGVFTDDVKLARSVVDAVKGK